MVQQKEKLFINTYGPPPSIKIPRTIRDIIAIIANANIGIFSTIVLMIIDVNVTLLVTMEEIRLVDALTILSVSVTVSVAVSVWVTRNGSG